MARDMKLWPTDPALFAGLAGVLEGECLTDAASRELLATDGSIFRLRPSAVVYPKHAADVVATLRFAARHHIPVHSRGAGSGLCGSALGRGIVLDFSRHMNRLIDLDIAGRTFTCEPGYRLGELDAALRGSDLFYPPDPSSGEYATFGGMVGTNASGARSVKYGSTVDYIEDAELCLATGEVLTLSELRGLSRAELPSVLGRLASLYEENAAAIESAYPDVRSNSTGYDLRGLIQEGRLDLTRLLAGSEGTLAVVTRLTMRLAPKPPHECLVVAYFDDIERSAQAVQKLLPLDPAAIEIMDKSLLALARRESPALRDRLPDVEAEGVDNVLLIEFHAFEEGVDRDAARHAAALLAEAGLTHRVFVAASAEEKNRFMAVRKAAVPILYRLSGRRRILALVEDAVAPTDRLVEYVRGIYEFMARRGVEFVLYGHIAKGLLHTRPLLDLTDPEDLAKLKPLADDLFELVSRLGGAVSGEHGDGRLRSPYVRRQYPTIHGLFAETKRLFDPEELLNPDIICVDDDELMTKELRFGAAYARRESRAPLLAVEGGALGLARIAETCHGCSKCATVTDATRMCPVYKATREESAAPKAKANVLRMVLGSGLVDLDSVDIEDAAVDAVMRRCIQCGSCALECPSGVDIPKLVLEARARRVVRHGAPLSDRVAASVELGAQLVRPVTAVAGRLLDNKAARLLMERVVGIASDRPLPLPASRSLFEQLPQCVGGAKGGRKVLYFAGCAASRLTPEIGLAAVRVLRRLGYEVLTPEQHCCGLPLLSKGLAEQARAKVAENLAAWGDLVGQVEAVVVSCPSCGLALTAEWRLLAQDDRRKIVEEIGAKLTTATALAVSRMNGSGLDGALPRVAYHQPCHLRSLAGGGASRELLSMLAGSELASLPSRCCGMAGSWGMNAKNAELSRSIGAKLADDVRAAGARLIATDCATCALQLSELTGLEVKHPLELLDEQLPGE